MRPISLRTAHLDKMLPRIMKRHSGKPLATRLVVNRTFGSAMSIIEDLREISLSGLEHELDIFERFVFSENFSEPCREQLKLAIIDSEKFTLELHGFYTEFITTVKEKSSLSELALFVADTIKAVTISKGVVLSDVANAYANLILEVVEYIRPNKLDITRDVRGISVNGSMLTGNAIYPYSDLPALESFCQLGNKKAILSEKNAEKKLFQRYQDLGMPIKNFQDVTVFETHMQRMANEYASVFPFINEYTYDILPHTQAMCQDVPLRHVQIHSEYSVDYLVEALKHRVRTLPSNGTKFIFEGICDGVKSLLIKEVIVDGRVQVLYRLYTIHDNLFGCYEPASNYLFTALQFVSNSQPAYNFVAILVNLYASQVLDLGDSQNFSIMQEDKSGALIPVSIGTERMDGPLIDWYHHFEHPNDPPAPPLLNRVNAEIRRLPAGVEAPEEARTTARALGYDLQANEVLLLPYRLDTKVQTYRLLG